MIPPEIRALLVLAASELTNGELRALGQQVAKEGSPWLVRQITVLREGQWQVEKSKAQGSVRSEYDRERADEYESLIKKVESLLLREAGLSKTAAAQMLVRSLKEDASSKNMQLPTSTKVAFDIWLARLLDAVPESIVLHHASKLRNAVVHGSMSRSSWPLSRADD